MNGIDPKAAAGSLVDPANVAENLASGRRNGDRQQIHEAAQQFEALFMEQLITQMRDAQLSEGFFGESSGSSVYEGMFSRYMADHLAADSPLGIAQLLEERLAGAPGGTPETGGGILARVATVRAERAYRSAGEAAPSLASIARGQAERAGARQGARPASISRAYGWGDDPIDGKQKFHHGVDLPAPSGTPVLAVAPGRVVSHKTTPGYGLQVVVRHADGWTTRYAHLSGSEAREGQWIGRGQVLGRVGSSGRSTGPHLHFEALLEGRRVDPAIAAPGDLRSQVLGRAADKHLANQR